MPGRVEHVLVSSKRLGAILAAALLVSTGCNAQQARHAYSPTESRLSMLGLRYGLYTGQHKGKPPTKLEELRTYVTNSIKPEQLAAFGASNADDLFVSARDGEAFTLVAMSRLPPPSASGQHAVVLYETTGQDGKRFVAFLGGGVQEVDAEQFRKLLPAAE